MAIRMAVSGGNVTALCSSALWLKIEIVLNLTWSPPQHRTLERAPGTLHMQPQE